MSTERFTFNRQRTNNYGADELLLLKPAFENTSTRDICFQRDTPKSRHSHLSTFLIYFEYFKAVFLQSSSVTVGLSTVISFSPDRLLLQAYAAKVTWNGNDFAELH